MSLKLSGYMQTKAPSLFSFPSRNKTPLPLFLFPEGPKKTYGCTPLFSKPHKSQACFFLLLPENTTSLPHLFLFFLLLSKEPIWPTSPFSFLNSEWPTPSLEHIMAFYSHKSEGLHVLTITG